MIRHTGLLLFVLLVETFKKEVFLFCISYLVTYCIPDALSRPDVIFQLITVIYVPCECTGTHLRATHFGGTGCPKQTTNLTNNKEK